LAGDSPRPRWGNLQRSPRSPSWILGGLLLRGRGRDERGKEGNGREGEGGQGREGRRGERKREMRGGEGMGREGNRVGPPR